MARLNLLELAALEANLPRLKAQRRMETEDLSKLHHDDLYDLVMLATGSEALANAYRVSAIKAATWHKK